MPDSKSSAVSRPFRSADSWPGSRGPRQAPGGSRGLAAVMGVVLLLALIGIAAAVWCFRHGYTLYYGDAEAHLNIARRVFDSRTPGGEQLGTVWLPLPHVLMVPFVMADAHGKSALWRNGLAGVIPSCACFILAGAFLFAAARRAYASASAALCVALLFALNPNMLYLESTPMTEPLLAASIAALLWTTLWFRDSQSIVAIFAAAAASNAASLTRYEGWFLIPFVSLYILAVSRHKWHALLFGVLAALGPLAWLAHNQFYYGNPLEFYNGPYSAMAIYRRQLAQGIKTPGDHDWRTAVQYYFAAAQLVVSRPLLAMMAIGALAALWKRAWWGLLLFVLTPIFYIASMHSGATPIFVPHLWPNGWYNTRYALAVLPLAAMAGGAIVSLLPSRFGPVAAVVLAAIPTAAWAREWIQNPAEPPSICWKESEVNSEARRVWTSEAADYLSQHYESGSGIIFSFGDLTGVLREAGIPLREGLHEGNHPAWDAAILRPELFLHEPWAIAFAGDSLSAAISKSDRRGRQYDLKEQITVKGAPVVEIYQWHPPPIQ